MTHVKMRAMYLQVAGISLEGLEGLATEHAAGKILASQRWSFDWFDTIIKL